MDKKERKVEFHLFHSVKGGCGKTANATFFVYRQIFGKSPVAGGIRVDTGNPKICLVDADFRGSELEIYYRKYYDDKSAATFFVQDFENGEKRKDGSKHRYYSQDIIDLNDMDTQDRLDTVVCMKGGRSAFKQGWAYHIAFCNPNTETKNAFVTNTTRFDGSSVKVDFFKDLFRQFLMLLAEAHDVIVIDMSPGRDEYTKAIFDICLDMRFKKEVKKHIDDCKPCAKPESVDVTLHLVTTPDDGHIESVGDYIIGVMAERGMREISPDKIDVIINETKYFGYNTDHKANIERKVKDQLNAKLTSIKSAPNEPVPKFSYQKFLDKYNFSSTVLDNNPANPLLDTAVALAKEYKTDWLQDSDG